MICQACKSEDLKTIKTKVSPFVAKRVFNVDWRKGGSIDVNLMHCPKCGLLFYDRALSEQEESRLYRDYRSDTYQKERQSYDPWYTPEINDLLRNCEEDNAKRKDIIAKTIKHSGRDNFKRVLDFGGDVGKQFPDMFNSSEKYIFDISNAIPIEGVTKVDRYDWLKDMDFDCIMCNMVLEHVSDPDKLIKRLKEIGSPHTLYYIEVPYESPYFDKTVLSNLHLLLNKYYPLRNIIMTYIARLKFKAFAPMTEHVRFFTELSLKLLFEHFGYKMIYMNVDSVICSWNRTRVLSALFESNE
jgi:hypothetical protein